MFLEKNIRWRNARSFLNVIILFSSKRNLGLYICLFLCIKYICLWFLRYHFQYQIGDALCFLLTISNIPFKNVLQHLNLIYSEFDLCGISFSLQSSFKLVTIYSSRLLALERKSFPRKPVFCNFLCNVQNLGARMPEKINSP